MESVKWTDVISMLGSIATGVGVVLVYRQLRAAAQTARATFASQLGHEFTDHYWRIYRRFLEGGSLSVTTPPEKISAAAELAIEQYANFFDTMEVVWRQQMIDLEIIDSIFAYRFFVSINNPHVIRIIRAKRAYWPNLIRLYRDWRAYREARRLDIPNAQFNLLADASPA